MDSRLRGNDEVGNAGMTMDFAHEFEQLVEQIETSLARIESQLEDFLSEPRLTFT
jgi:hypothetical protein